jgi:hypothetical protein
VRSDQVARIDIGPGYERTVMFRQLLRTAKEISGYFCRNGRARGGLYVRVGPSRLFGHSEPLLERRISDGKN